MKENFQRSLDLVLKHEGGYVDNPRDPGGATNLGITHHTLASWRGHAVSKRDVKNLSRAEAADIYKANYWDEVQGDRLPSGVDYAVFDYAVNSGVYRAARELQRVVGASVDGFIGPKTMQAVEDTPSTVLINDLLDSRMAFLKRLSTWDAFGRGWTNRVNGVREHALEMADAPDKPTEPHTAPEISTVLRRSDEYNEDVETLQAALNEDRRAGGEIAVDGYYGPVTVAAVLNYQTKHGLAVDGISGPETLSHLGLV